MVFTKLFKQAESLVVDNSAAILTGVGITGVFTTAVLTARASFKAAEIIAEKNDERMEEGVRKVEREDTAYDVQLLNQKEKVLLVWPQYVPAVGAGITTVSAIFFSHKISSTKTAAMAAAYGISEKAFQEYKEKVVEKLGDKKEMALRDEIAQDQVKRNPVDDRTVIVVGGDVLCYDTLIGRYFQSTMERIKQAEIKTNEEIINHSYASLSFFYDLLDLPGSDFADQVGWNMSNLLEIQYSTVMSTDNRPCISIGFKTQPFPEYEQQVY